VTDGLDQALANAGIALLQADTSLVVFDGAVPRPTPDVSNGPGYVLVYTTVDRPSDDLGNALDGRTRVWTGRWICHCVGGNAAAARAVAQRVRTALLDVRPVVTGLATGPIRWEQSNPPLRDESTGLVVMDAVEIYRLLATN
jgi:hypothetical protein